MVSDGTADEPEDGANRSARARSFGAKARAYAAHRPDYPAAAIQWGLAKVSLSNPPDAQNVLDLAAGTGKLTAGLVQTGARVTAVEPDGQMRAQLTVLLPTVPALDGTAERIPVAEHSMDAVFAGQALHWFDLEPALAEIHRVLRPGGPLSRSGITTTRRWLGSGELAVLCGTGNRGAWTRDVTTTGSGTPGVKTGDRRRRVRSTDCHHGDPGHPPLTGTGPADDRRRSALCECRGGESHRRSAGA
jgi:SAM-dependent methyltransferase